MHLVLVAAMVSNQLWFDMHHDAQYYEITPMVSVTEPCTCQVTVAVTQQGSAGNSTSRQSGEVNLNANQQQALGRMRFSVPSGGSTQIAVTVSDGGALILTHQVVLPGNT
ncbi:curli assembly chaperone CsgC [Shimwellia blattae]|uniref:Curli assembly protein CsgC n=1 Tax=Shimwellia blattae (strain ATCC 29907 / DSM 4481 / JCM 1650 / NBRC 105725 / CDC 9005-74) TaxID=630626 RepID=I2BCF5_SHIBC|nr:curli assembly chaperone CsgC [Shimwellia blattae]AFJ48209.1 curli production protein CsgC [Shimwellia blattae DSM 4481 = NBRC 105725]GAB82768.1 curli assembly protein CsgC [Shimwellia blattae DSM 4481 = NBRC 105725]VDY65705.1 Curli assembly protein CsgC precursor [Shimwellia blattae]VEC25446.1 Curli assembly protein CsgC precursor [Shimwellia blattae]